MGSRPELLKKECPNCVFVNMTLGMGRHPNEYFCSITNSLQPRVINNRYIDCGCYKEKLGDWDR